MSKRGQEYNNECRNGIYKEDGAGMEYIQALKKASAIQEKEVIKPTKVVATFGITDNNGHEILMGWKVNTNRKDPRHGVVDEPAPACRYSNSLFNSMFAGWN